MATKTIVKTSDTGTKREHGHYSLPRWLWMTFINMILSAIIFFLAGILVLSLVFPRVYESAAEIYVAAESGNTKVSASALGQVLSDSAKTEILGELTGFEKIPESMRIKINTDLGESIVSVKAYADDPYSSFDAVKKAIDISKAYLAKNSSTDSMRIVSYPQIAKQFSYMFMLEPALWCALAGFLLAFFMSLIIRGSYKNKYYAAKKKKEQEVALAYAAFSADDDRVQAQARTRVQNESEDLIKSLNEYSSESDAKRSGEDLKKIMSAKDPYDESGRIIIPDYTDMDDSDFDDDPVNFLTITHADTSDEAIEEDFDDESEEEDLAKLFGDVSEDVDDTDDFEDVEDTDASDDPEDIDIVEHDDTDASDDPEDIDIVEHDDTDASDNIDDTAESDDSADTKGGSQS